MLPYRLLVRANDTLGVVTHGVMPPFQMPPEVITWGMRVFVRDHTSCRADRYDYIEVFVWSADSEQREYEHA